MLTPDDDDIDECPLCLGDGTERHEGHDHELIETTCTVCCGAGYITYLQAQRLRAALRAEAMD